MPESTINWDENLPSGSSAIKLGDDDVRNLTVALGDGLDAEHHWDNTQGSANRGLHRKGSARAYIDVQSRMSGSGSSEAGKLYFASNTSRLFVTPDSGTSVQVGSIAHPEVIEIRDAVAYGPQFRPVIEAGSGTGASGGAGVVVFNSEYEVAPVVIAVATTAVGVGISSITIGGFAADTNPSGGDFYWQSIGTKLTSATGIS